MHFQNVDVIRFFGKFKIQLFKMFKINLKHYRYYHVNKLILAYFAGVNTNDVYDAFKNVRNDICLNFHLINFDD